MAETKRPLLESAGWGFCIVTFFVIVGPSIYFSKSASYSDTSAMVWIGIGLFCAGGLAAIITTVVNTIIQARLSRIEEAERKADKKKKK